MKKINRIEKLSYSIIVDGETEIWYLQMMKKNETFSAKIDIKPEIPKRKKLNDQISLVKENLNIGYDKIIWIIDYDTVIKKDRETKKGQNKKSNALKNQIISLKKKYKDRFVVLINNPCLEFWFLLHYKDTSKFYSSCKEAENDLKKHLIGYQKTQKYFKKNNNDIYSKLKEFQEKAYRNAKSLGNFDFSNIDKSKAEIYNILNILGIK